MAGLKDESPILATVHPAPLFVLLYTSLVEVPTYRGRICWIDCQRSRIDVKHDGPGRSAVCAPMPQYR